MPLLKVGTHYSMLLEEPGMGKFPIDLVHLPADKPEALNGIEVLWSQIFTAEMAQYSGSLQLIQSTGAGLELIDFDHVPSGCQVAIVHEHQWAIAEWVIMAMVSLNREAPKLDRDVREHKWDHHPINSFSASATELNSQTLGIIGFGHIGRQVSKYASALGMKVKAVTRNPPSHDVASAHGAQSVENLDRLVEVISDCDHVLVTVALVDETESLIGQDELSAMRDSACLINVARGPVVNERALYQALEGGQIAGAALDVWWQEPNKPGDLPMPSKYDFAALTNVLMSPHTSAMTKEVIRRRLQAAYANFDRFKLGEPIEGVI
jgi:phosphoglycerate dehydrogenase-like enzyme|tara:strand:- start:3315 stop:4280 length:966 start_codon:yes stop_codon:yes gene_type:complete